MSTAQHSPTDMDLSPSAAQAARTAAKGGLPSQVLFFPTDSAGTLIRALRSYLNTVLPTFALAQPIPRYGLPLPPQQGPPKDFYDFNIHSFRPRRHPTAATAYVFEFADFEPDRVVVVHDHKVPLGKDPAVLAQQRLIPEKVAVNVPPECSALKFWQALPNLWAQDRSRRIATLVLDSPTDGEVTLASVYRHNSQDVDGTLVTVRLNMPAGLAAASFVQDFVSKHILERVSDHHRQHVIVSPVVLDVVDGYLHVLREHGSL
ncbi:hypothetical protein BCR44DRAFT_27655 [Catenaria anguillulae PL171]|uniref:Uncharacterized protein n=1 Tax=Catenaria anguillulae PL171 TaxID=765915 RepID=A0A1Y2I6D4_9FUNG|nr:hypothetical protein BCR44DRAFT_27655 [Catenaria anguillulae PL171]